MMTGIINIASSGVHHLHIILPDSFWSGLKRESDDIRNFLISFFLHIIMLG